MAWYDVFAGPPFDPATYEAPRGIPSPDAGRSLALYKYDACPYCQRVRRALSELPELAVETRDTLRDRSNRTALAQATGRTQAPCLFIDDVPLFESDDIVRWLKAYAARGGKADGSEVA